MKTPLDTTLLESIASLERMTIQEEGLPLAAFYDEEALDVLIDLLDVAGIPVNHWPAALQNRKRVREGEQISPGPSLFDTIDVPW